MQDGAPVSSAGRKLERVSNGAPRGMAATRGVPSGAARAQNPAYRPALPPHSRKKPARFIDEPRRLFLLPPIPAADLRLRRSRTSA
ncbi:hypothetical protein PSAC2689_20019 [Paraburkholderia sacchari]